ncbi:putative signal peptidase complex subunit 2-like protein [Leptotrombidium deliense]|uniref:Signal peptidase complex subunit 2 n=1 Tax=Leptotrombidium deliense TaxID=299467 RepID=A0A443S120_9ACAR|nr:putative signal peptidase complex subunit 2-like protein [Leptotrombidium deliense]
MGKEEQKNVAAGSGDESDEKEEVKIDKWDGTALKNTLDDTVRKIFTEKYKYVECHKLMDIRLTICVTAVSAAMFALVYDYFNPFPASKIVLITCVLTYFTLMGILTLYTTMVEKGIFLVVKSTDVVGMDPPKVFTVSSYLKRFDDIYTLSIEFTDGRGSKPVEVSLSKSVANWFDENGILVDRFENDVTDLHSQLKSGKKSK